MTYPWKLTEPQVIPRGRKRRPYKRGRGKFYEMRQAALDDFERQFLANHVIHAPCLTGLAADFEVACRHIYWLADKHGFLLPRRLGKAIPDDD